MSDATERIVTAVLGEGVATTEYDAATPLTAALVALYEAVAGGCQERGPQCMNCLWREPCAARDAVTAALDTVMQS